MALRWKLLILIAVTAVVAGVVLWGQPPRPQRTRTASHASSAARETHRPDTTAANVAAPSVGAPGGPGPSTVVDGIPMGYRHDHDGARAAALAFARAAETITAMDDPRAEAAQRAMAATDASEALVSDLRAKLARLRTGWPVGSITYRVAPVAVKIVDDGPDAVRADVWYVGVVAGTNIAPYEQWGTESFRLVWERDDWRVAADTVVGGPRPEPGGQRQFSAAEVEARLAGFEAVR